MQDKHFHTKCFKDVFSLQNALRVDLLLDSLKHCSQAQEQKNMLKKLLQELDVFHLLFFLDIAKDYTGVCQMGMVTLLVLTSAIFPKVFLFFLDSLLENALDFCHVLH